MIDAMKQALDAIDSAHADMRDEIAALRQAIQQYEKEQAEFNELVEQVRGLEKQACEIIRGAEKQAALDKMADNAQEIGLSYEVHTDHPMRYWDRTCPACLAEEQEPVAIGEEWKPCMKLPILVHVREQREGEDYVSTREGITPVRFDDLIMRGVAGEEYPIGRELFSRTYTFYTAPPRKEWVGLTFEEAMVIAADFGEMDSHKEQYLFVQAIEAKLKEKNNG